MIFQSIEFEYYQLIWRLILSIIFFIMSILFVKISFKANRNFNSYGYNSTLLTSFLFVIFGVYNLISPLVPWPYYGFLVFWIGILMIIFSSFAIIIYFLNKRKSDVKKKENQKIKSIENPDQTKQKSDLDAKGELYRKLFHLVSLIMIIGYYFLMRYIHIAIYDTIFNVVPNEYELIWGDLSYYPYEEISIQANDQIIFFALIALWFLIGIPDVIRVLISEKYSLYDIVTRSVLRKKEFNAAGPHTYLVAGTSFVYLLHTMNLIPIEVVFTALLISAISDGLAAVIGKRYGKHKLTSKHDKKKSIEGFLAGGCSALVIGLIFVSPLAAIISGIIFVLLDFYSFNISDNLLNPMFIGVALILIN